MRSIGTETKVGIFVLLGIILLAYFTIRVGRIAVREEGYRVYSYVESAAGLDKNSPVRIAGVEVGKVEDHQAGRTEGQDYHAPPLPCEAPPGIEGLREIRGAPGREIHRDRSGDRRRVHPGGRIGRRRRPFGGRGPGPHPAQHHRGRYPASHPIAQQRSGGRGGGKVHQGAGHGGQGDHGQPAAYHPDHRPGGGNPGEAGEG